MRPVNLNSLRMFDAAARHLNFRLAADEMNLTQGAVAQQVRRLESDLGQVLFHRQARGLALTRTGATYHGAVRKALALIDDATRQLTVDTAGVALSVPPSFAAKWLVPRLGQFQQDHPEIELRIVADEAVSRFDRDGVDLAVRQGPPPTADGVDHRTLAPLDLRAVTSADLARSIGPVTTLADLGGFTLIQDGHRHWDRLVDSGAVEPSRRMLQVNQTGLAMDAAQNGQGIALVPGIYLDKSRGALVSLWAFSDTDGTGFHLVWPRTKPLSAACQSVRDWLTGQFSGATAAQTAPDTDQRSDTRDMR